MTDREKAMEPAARTGGVVPAAQNDSLLSMFYFAALISLYKIALDISYRYVADIFEYQGLFADSRTALSQTVSWIILFCGIPFFKLVFDQKTISGNILSTLILFSVIPTITTFAFRSDYESTYVVLQILYWVTLFITWLALKPIHLTSLRVIESRVFYLATWAVLAASVLLYSYINTGLRFHFSLIDVYDIRSEAREFEAPFPLNYLVSLADNLLPFFAIYALHHRRFVLFAATVIFIYINFSVAGTKQIIFVLILGITGYFYMKDFSRSQRLVLAAIGFIIISMAEALIFGSNTLNTLFAYRVLFIPAELHYNYYSYFQMNDVLYFTQSILKWFTNVEQENIQFLLGQFSIGDFTARANNGLFSDAYMNLGVVGVFIFPPIIALYLRMLDGSVSGLPSRILFVITVYIAFVLLGMTLTSALLTSGLGFLLILLYSMPRSGPLTILPPGSGPHPGPVQSSSGPVA